MEKMRVILIALFSLFIVMTTAKVDTSKALNPLKEVDISDVTPNPVTYAKAINPAREVVMSEAINHMLNKSKPSYDKAINPAREVVISEAINTTLNKSPPEAYESPKFKRFVAHCSSHVADTCSSGTKPLHHEGGINRPYKLAFCLFDSMEKCLVDHGASLYQATPTNHQGLSVPLETSISSKYQSILVETLKFRTVLRTCSHVTARSCYTSPNVAKSALTGCLIPSLNQCVYPEATTTGSQP